jgi:hypothetical protein
MGFLQFVDGFTRFKRLKAIRMCGIPMPDFTMLKQLIQPRRVGLGLSLNLTEFRVKFPILSQ